jgi:protein-arginine deiminase
MCGCLSSEPDPPDGSADAGLLCDPDTQSCPLATIVVHVRIDSAGGKEIDGAEVSIEGPSSASQPSDSLGRAVFSALPPGAYKVKAGKDGLVPEPAESAVQGVAGETTEVTLVLQLVEYHLHLDADRDGSVDADWRGIDTWEWGKSKKGAVMLCNDDGDEVVTASDHADDKVGKGNDASELAPVVIRRIGPEPPKTWKLELSIDKKDKARVFAARASASKEILGPAKGASWVLPDVAFTDKELGIEAVSYANKAFDGEVTLTLKVTRTSGSSYEEKGKLRVAPWMMPNHLEAAEKVYVVKHVGYNDRFVVDLKAAVGVPVVEHPGTDIWMQDGMEWGYSSLPSSVGLRSVLRAPRDRPLKTYPQTLRDADLGYLEQGAPSTATVNSFGNLEVSPPVTSKAGKRYPWGRIYFGPGRIGEKIDGDLKTFLSKQVVQEPIEIDTGWLLVAHVDEILSFVPAPGPKGFKLLIASPDLAYKLLDDNKAAHPTERMLTGRKFPDHLGALSIVGEVTIKDFLDKGLKALGARFDAAYLRSYNAGLQTKLRAIRKKLESELGLVPADIVEVPILFVDHTQAGLADALTAGMVNMLVVNGRCVFPKPFGPVVAGVDLFQKDLEDKLTGLGLTPKPIDDWYEYHIALGEVHCGTNTLRSYTAAKWWEFVP